MKTDQKILELIADCKKALDNESFAYTKHVVFGMAPLLIGAVEQLFGQRKDAYAQTDKIHGENLGLHITLTQIRDVIGATKNWNNAEWSTLPGLVQKALDDAHARFQQEVARLQNEKMIAQVEASGAQNLRAEVADLKAQLTVAERISNDRDEARVTGLSEIAQLRNDLANARIASKQNLDAYDALHKRHQVTVSDFNAACDERDSLRLKLDTQTKIAVACQDAVDRATREQVERMKAIREGKLAERISHVICDTYKSEEKKRLLGFNSRAYTEAVLADLVQIPIELPSAEHIARVFIGAADNEQITAQRIRDGSDVRGMIMNRIAPLLAAHDATKIELPSIEEMHEQFDVGFEEAISETRGSNVYASDANGLRRVRNLIAARFGLTEQKPTKTETVASIEVSGPAPSLWDQFRDELTLHGRTMSTGRTATIADVLALVKLLDR